MTCQHEWDRDRRCVNCKMSQKNTRKNDAVAIEIEKQRRNATWSTRDLNDFLELSPEEEAEITKTVTFNQVKPLYDQGFVSRRTLLMGIYR